jgi:hypothetical protein
VTAVASAWTAVYTDCVAELALSPLKTTALGGREMTPPNCWQGRQLFSSTTSPILVVDEQRTD